MNKKNKRKEEEPQINLDLGLGGLFKGIGNLVELVSEMAEKGQSTVEGTKEFTGEGALKDLKGVYGFSVKTGLGGTPEVETFGNIKKTPKGPVVEEIREPMSDIFDEEKIVQVIVEMPGVQKKDVKVDLQGDMLTISAQNPKRKYQKEILLPAKVKPDSLFYAFKNGILEIRLDK